MILIKILYKTKKWDKEITECNKVREKIKENYGTSSIEQLNINYFIKEYLSKKGRISDLISLYYQIGGQYYLMAETEWLLCNNAETCAVNLYLYLLSKKISYDLLSSGEKTKNLAIERSMLNNKDFKLIFCTAIALNQFELFEDYQDRCPIITSLYQGKYDYAKILVNQLPETVCEDREVYYKDDEHLKNIYLSILNRDEQKFNEELLVRIKKLRKNMVGYLTIVDVVSIALIKIAEKQGLKYNFDVIEIPRFFIDNFEFDFKSYKLPDIE